jgi:Phage portal protein
MAERGPGQPKWPLSPYEVNVQYSVSQGISRGTGADWFGPLNPLAPTAPPEVAGRRFDFRPGYNLLQQPRAYEPVSFEKLRQFADACDLLRLVIETRKDQMERQRWTIKPRDPVLRRMSTRPAEMQSRIDSAIAFLRKPDGYASWKSWVRSLLEDMFVIDAATLYCQRTRGGRLMALHQLDGATIKRVIDDWGRTPMPYRGADGALVLPPAYQQVLKGLPAVNYSTRDIIYRPRNVRSHKVYGYSPVQQVMLTVQIALRRQMWQLDYYTEGSIPDALIGVPSTWTVQQIRDFQDYWDTEFSGDLAKRRRAKFVPGEVARGVHQTKEPDQKNVFDEWLARVICYAFSVSPQWAVSLMNRATAKEHSDQAQEEGLEPTKEWVKDLCDDVIADELDSSDLELAWVEEDDIDPTKHETILEGRVKVGAITLNEFRDNIGLERYADEAANRPMAMTPQGYVPIEAYLDAPPGRGAPSPLSGAPNEATSTTATQEDETATEESSADGGR